MRTSSYMIRPAQAKDAPRVHELHTASVRTLCSSHYASDVIDGWLLHRRPESYLAPIERGDLFVVEHNGIIVGFGEAIPGTVVAVYVDPGAARAGVGSTIMEHALTAARRGHIGPIRLESTLNAEAFYRRFGFREVKRSSVQRNEVTVPVVVMERDDA